MFENNDTIFALSSGNPPAGVGVVRISGAGLEKLFSEITKIENPTPRHLYFAKIPDVDDVLAVYFKAPASFTGEDVIEIHSHGSSAVIEKVFAMLKNLGARLAERGEFSARAFLNGKMDLQQVDGLADLIHAKTERQRVQAFASYTGEGSRLYHSWRARLVKTTANLAAAAEFPEDELPGGLVEDARAEIRALVGEIESHLGTYAAGRAIKSGFRIVLAGEVNAGKSSLFNALLGRSRAIVSDAPGTTRDFITAETDIGGYLVELVDTAGLRETKNEVESAGIEKSRDLISCADLVINVVNPKDEVPGRACGLPGMTIRTHADLYPGADVSVKTGAGVSDLIARIKNEIKNRLESAEPAMVSNEKTAALLGAAAEYLGAALAENVPELAAENVRLAADALGKILGEVDFDEIQSAIFGRLCLGK
ncbi:MAG: tRNA uridine-5-carboxymethylaminomethyl(34) synthesis GTPase MnmE [Rickettsiales bacterium]|jgi:tRNA modification GTPase|nr:tRNA uridine-5-carboxymethylaminomethyl(34) synthesis GTPase MnmE [Rickettsiales bacterium]